MPYTKLLQLGIIFQNMPQEIEEDVGKTPRKPHKYGPAQMRKIWATRDTWSFVISNPASIPATTSTSTTTPNEP